MSSIALSIASGTIGLFGLAIFLPSQSVVRAGSPGLMILSTRTPLLPHDLHRKDASTRYLYFGQPIQEYCHAKETF
jgi:hypothetical protein